MINHFWSYTQNYLLENLQMYLYGEDILMTTLNWSDCGKMWQQQVCDTTGQMKRIWIEQHCIFTKHQSSVRNRPAYEPWEFTRDYVKQFENVKNAMELNTPQKQRKTWQMMSYEVRITFAIAQNAQIYTKFCDKLCEWMDMNNSFYLSRIVHMQINQTLEFYIYLFFSSNFQHKNNRMNNSIQIIIKKCMKFMWILCVTAILLCVRSFYGVIFIL